MSGMKKVRIKATEMRDADVHFISLVKRAANRMPVRILKQEDIGGDMALNLEALGNGTATRPARVKKADKPVAAPAQVLAFIVSPQDDAQLEKFTEALKADGHNVDHVIKHDDGTVAFEQVEGGLQQEYKLVRLSDSSMVALRGFQPYNFDMNGADFNDTAKANGFYQGVDSALDVAYTNITKILSDTTTVPEAVTKVETLMEGLKEYVANMVSTLPAAAFKADAEITKIRKSDEEAKALDAKGTDDLLIIPDEDDKSKEEPKLDADGKPLEEIKPDPNVKPIETEAPAANPTPGTEVKEPVVAPVQSIAEPAKKGEGADDMSKVLLLLTGFGERLTAIESAQASAVQKGDLENLKSVVDTVAQKQETVSKQLAGTVTALPKPADTPGLELATKSDEDPEFGNGYFDTSFMSKRRK